MSIPRSAHPSPSSTALGVLTLAILLWLPRPGSAQTDVTLGFTEEIEPDLPVTHMVSGDFNEDGVTDLIVLSPGGPLTILESDGQGGLEPRSLGTPATPHRAAVGDVNEDGHLDFVTVDDSEFRFFAGTGNGTFAPGVQFAAPAANPTDVHLVDVDGDDHLDLLASFRTSGTSLAVRLGDGAGGFGPTDTYAGISATDLATGDLDADGNLDVVTMDLQDDFQLYFGAGGGTFDPPLTVNSGTLGTPFHVGVGDFDEDGFDDVMWTPGSSVAYLHRSDGSRGLGSRETIGTGTLTGLRGPNVADWDDDGHLDCAFFGFQNISLFFGDGTGSFPEIRFFMTADFVEGVVTTDIDSDGLLDLLAYDEEGGINVLRGLGNRNFDGAAISFPPGGIAALVAGDLDDDGNLDVVASGAGATTVFYGDGDGGLSEPDPAFGATPFLDILNVADYNGDGRDDLAQIAPTTREIHVYLSLGGGAYSAPVVTSGVLLETLYPDEPSYELVTADFNEDGILDLAIAERTDAIAILLGDGAGGFTVGSRIDDGSLLFDPLPALAEDLDGDGHVDLLVTRQVSPSSRGPNRMSVLRGDGTGQLTLVQHISRAGSFLVHDANEDGLLDLLIGHENTRLYLLPGTGTPIIFGAEVVLHPQVRAPRQLLDADLDGDGDLEIVGVGEFEFDILFNEPGPENYDRTTIQLGLDPAAALLEDFDEDGLADIVSGFATLSILRNRTRFEQAWKGNVNGAVGDPTNVLFVNDSPGYFSSRTVFLGPDDSIELRLDATPSGGTRFVVYGWLRTPSSRTVTDVGFGLGSSALPMPPTGVPGFRPLAIWKTIPGHLSTLGEPTHPASEAPTILASAPQLGFLGEFVFQGLMLDQNSPQGQAAVTNAVRVLSEGHP